MIALVVGYSCLVGFLFYAFADLAERILLAAGVATRGVWVAAMLATLGFSFRALIDRDSVSHGLSYWSLVLSALDGPLVFLCAALMLASAGSLAGGWFALRACRRRWRAHTLGGTNVLVSADAGPALVGLRDPAIVVPEWALDATAEEVRMMLLHEGEHRRRNDGRLLLAAQCGVACVRWNVGLCWQLRRLRLAVELDCDARVVRHIDRGSYGTLLVDCLRPSRCGRAINGTALVERPRDLERRLRALGERRRISPRRAVAAVTALGLVSGLATWRLPSPRRATTNVAPVVIPPIGHLYATRVEFARGRYLIPDDRGPYIAGQDGSDSFFEHAAWHRWVFRSTRLGPSGEQRYVMARLDDPADSRDVRSLGLIRDPRLQLIVYREHGNLDDMPVGRPEPVAKITVHVQVAPTRYALVFGSKAPDAGNPRIHGAGTSSGVLTRLTDSTWSVMLPAGSVGRLWERPEDRRPRNHGLYRFDLTASITRLP